MNEIHNPAHPGEALKEWLSDLTMTQAVKDLKNLRTALLKF